MKTTRILIAGAGGPLTTELAAVLRERFGAANVITAGDTAASDILLDVLDHAALGKVVGECGITQVYLFNSTPPADPKLAAGKAWDDNVRRVIAVLEMARMAKLDKVFWPSGIDIFTDTAYGISKMTGEYWCDYYFRTFGVDVRSLRLPYLVCRERRAGEGMTAYIADLVLAALEQRPYTCYLDEDQCLPVIYLPDAARAMVQLMNAPKEKISIRTSYNLSGLRFAPCDLEAVIKRQVPELRVNYAPDYRQAIASGHDTFIRDMEARLDWGWAPAYGLDDMAHDLLSRLAAQPDFYPHETL